VILESDTFYVSSYVPDLDDSTIGNVKSIDASHRGGRPGFVKLVGNSLTIPDYFGNNLFNTLGNFIVNPKAGLTFVDFETGNVLMLTGKVQLNLEDNSSFKIHKGAERAWDFEVDHGLWLNDILPFRSNVSEMSPFLNETGHW